MSLQIEVSIVKHEKLYMLQVRLENVSSQEELMKNLKKWNYLLLANHCSNIIEYDWKMTVIKCQCLIKNSNRLRYQISFLKNQITMANKAKTCYFILYIIRFSSDSKKSTSMEKYICSFPMSSINSSRLILLS